MATLSIADFKTLWTDYEDADLPSDQICFMFLNEIDQTIYDKVRAVNPEEFISEDSVSVLDGTDTYALPADFDNIDYPEFTGLYEFNTDGSIKTAYPITQAGAKQTGFYLVGRISLVMTPEPSADVTLTLRYIPTKDLYTADSETLLLPKRYQKLYCDWFSWLFRTRNEERDPNTAMMFANKAVNAMLTEYNTSPPIARMYNAYQMHPRTSYPLKRYS